MQGEMDKQIARMLELQEQIRTYQNTIDTLQHDYNKIGDELYERLQDRNEKLTNLLELLK